MLEEYAGFQPAKPMLYENTGDLIDGELMGEATRVREFGANPATVIQLVQAHPSTEGKVSLTAQVTAQVRKLSRGQQLASMNRGAGFQPAQSTLCKDTRDLMEGELMSEATRVGEFEANPATVIQLVQAHTSTEEKVSPTAQVTAQVKKLSRGQQLVSMNRGAGFQPALCFLAGWKPAPQEIGQ